MLRYICLALIAPMSLAGCAGDRLDGGGATPGTGPSKADDPVGSTVCGIASGSVEARGVGEVGELDADPRLTANTTAAEVNASRDCQQQIDTCAVPHYWVDETGERTLVAIESSELVFARQLYIAGALVAEERPGVGCTLCSGDECPASEQCCRTCIGSQACGDSCIAEDLTCSQPPGCACQG